MVGLMDDSTPQAPAPTRIASGSSAMSTLEKSHWLRIPEAVSGGDGGVKGVAKIGLWGWGGRWYLVPALPPTFSRRKSMPRQERAWNLGGEVGEGAGRIEGLSIVRLAPEKPRFPGAAHPRHKQSPKSLWRRWVRGGGRGGGGHPHHYRPNRGQALQLPRPPSDFLHPLKWLFLLMFEGGNAVVFLGALFSCYVWRGKCCFFFFCAFSGEITWLFRKILGKISMDESIKDFTNSMGLTKNFGHLHRNNRCI